MSKELNYLMSFVLVLAVTGIASADQWEITVPDAGFDDHVLSNVGDYIYIGEAGYTGAWKSDVGQAWIDYMYWRSEGDIDDLVARSGDFKAYPSDGEAFDYIYQILDETFIEGGTYTLSVWVGNAWPASGYADGWGLYFTAEDYSINLIEAHGLALSGDWEQISLVYTATAADAGKKIGIKMSGEQGESYIAFEDVTLSYDGPPRPPIAANPTPEDGAMLEDTWASLSWKPADSAVSHDVYMADNFDDVNDRGAAAFEGNQTSASIVVGFIGFPFPEGLVPGTTYYWAIDEVEADGTTKHKGPVWSFWIQPISAYDPSPSDGGQYVDPDVTLGWKPGFGAKLHTVYFDDNFDDVNNATAGTPSAVTTFTPGPLELAKTYYWRVDESDPPNPTVKGDLWSFTTTLPGLGKAVASRWENITGTDLNTLKTNPRYPNNPDVTEEVMEFAWNGPDLDDYGGRIEAWLYVPSTGDFTFWLNTDDQGELWLSTDDDPGSAKLIARESSWSALNAWGAGEEKSRPVPLIGGQKYYIMAMWKEGGGGDHCQVAWQGPDVPERTVIAGTNLSPFEPMSAYGARPSNNSTGVTLMPILTWKPGLQAASHEVYFGSDQQAVADATKASPEYKGSRQLGSESLDPGKLAWHSTYYWRVDEIDNTNPASPWKGKVWSFTTGDFLTVDDFESYDDVDPAPGEPGLNRIFDKWIDGYGTLTNGALVGNEMPPYAETTIVHSGTQSMVYSYDNAGKTSEATLTLVWPRDWTEEGVTQLSLWLNGSQADAADRIYVALNGTAVIYHDDASATQIAGWTEWVIDLATFGVDLTNVNTITIGIGTKNAPAPGGGTGTMYFDDIRLIR
ncbi:MAG: hypothetical protein JSW59_10920 [Phycisphaerales bacterium]|nr:MAG: hypothetical protein JSW59_10920 [Phycisphaerales bacterium]